MIIAVGRSPYTEGLNLEEAEVKSDDKGFILVNEFNETSTKRIFAIGDCTLGPMSVSYTPSDAADDRIRV